MSDPEITVQVAEMALLYLILKLELRLGPLSEVVNFTLVLPQLGMLDHRASSEMYVEPQAPSLTQIEVGDAIPHPPLDEGRLPSTRGLCRLASIDQCG